MASCHLSCLSGCVNHPGPGNGLAFGETKSDPQPGKRNFGCKLLMHGYSRLASGKSPSEAAVIQNQEYEEIGMMGVSRELRSLTPPPVIDFDYSVRISHLLPDS